MFNYNNGIKYNLNEIVFPLSRRAEEEVTEELFAE
jgi:hypothetical protein